MNFSTLDSDDIGFLIEKGEVEEETKMTQLTHMENLLSIIFGFIRVNNVSYVKMCK